MSYYIARKAYLKKNGKISITMADSSIRPLRYFTCEYSGTTAEFLLSVQEGNIHLKNNKESHVLYEISEAINNLVRNTVDKAGLTLWETMKYDIVEKRRNTIMIACEMYADRIEKNNFTNSEEFGKVLGNRMYDAIQDGLNAIKKVKEKDKLEGKIRISTAARSIFKDYNLLFPCDWDDGPILAPAEDYNNKSVLQTDFKKIVFLGKEADDLYAYLSFTGISYSYEEYAAKLPGEAVPLLKNKFTRAIEAVKKAESAGLQLKEGVYPFKGYPLIDKAS